MEDSMNGSHIELHGLCLLSLCLDLVLTRKYLSDFMIGSPLPLPKLLRHPSRLVLKLSVNGVDEHYEQVLSTRGDTEDGIWEADGDVRM